MITAASTVHHDGTTYQPGQAILGLSDEQAAVLVACGAASASEPEPTKPPCRGAGD